MLLEDAFVVLVTVPSYGYGGVDNGIVAVMQLLHVHEQPGAFRFLFVFFIVTIERFKAAIYSSV